MTIRRRSLPEGWFPTDQATIHRFIDQYQIPEQCKLLPERYIAGIMVPHAGWAFSGKLCAQAYGSLARVLPDPELVILIGGHLPEVHPLVVITEDLWQMPNGSIYLDISMTQKLLSSFEHNEEPSQTDNSIEVQAPFVAHFFPNAQCMAFRVPKSTKLIGLAEKIAILLKEKNYKRVAIIASTDLTHYGERYGFAPVGNQHQKAIDFVHQNDRQFLYYVGEKHVEDLLSHSLKMRSACSSGSVALMVSIFEALSYDLQSSLIGYYTSYDVHPSDVMVGYGSILFH